MLDFELNVGENKMIVWKNFKEYHRQDVPQTDLTKWCIGYLKQYIYHSISDLVNGRMQSYAHVIYLDGTLECENLLLKTDRIYNQTDWIDAYSRLLRSDLLKIFPRSNMELKNNSKKN